MATTYTAVAAGGNWNSAATWDVGTGYPVAGDTAILNATLTGTVTVTAAAACAVLNMENNGGTLALGNNNITCTSNVTVDGTITAGTGAIILSGTAGKTLKTNGVTVPNISITSGAQTITLDDDLAVTYLNMGGNYGAMTFAGAHDATIDTLCFGFNYPISLTLPAGQTFRVTNNLYMFSNPLSRCTVKSGTSSSDAFLHFDGSASNCNVNNMIFTDINCAHAIDNWYGGTLTRTTGITNRTSADIGGGTGIWMPRARQIGV